jgi:hypothetical protein
MQVQDRHGERVWDENEIGLGSDVVVDVEDCI